VQEELVLLHGVINLIGPCEDTAFEVFDLRIPGVLQDLVRLRTAAAYLAMHDDVLRWAEVIEAVWELAEWDETRAVAGEIGDLPFMRLAHVNNSDVLLVIEFVLQLGWRDFPVSDSFCGRCQCDAAELIVINQAMDQGAGTITGLPGKS
jgi:hypothetical protein